jgi:uncharacterized protein YndB with AHSA1/START domain
MPDIVHDFPIFAPRDRVFDAIASSNGLDAWWTLTSSGEPGAGNTYALGFGPDHQWAATVTSCVNGFEIEWELTEADDDWRGTRVGFRLDDRGERHTDVHFHHTGWPDAGAHYRTSCYCWAMYLRILKRFVEHGEVVEYDRRLDV